MSELVPLVDPVENVFTLFDGIFRMVFPNHSARRYFGLKAISWKLTGAPGWFLWFVEKAGAYLVEVVDGIVDLAAGCSEPDRRPSGDTFEVSPRATGQNSPLSGDQFPTSRAGLRIRYFPDPADPNDCFEDFSVHEQIARLSGIFDDSGTPSFEGLERLHDGSFVVGGIACVLAAGGNYLEAAVSAPERWITSHSEGLFITEIDGQAHEVVPPGQPDRDVPAWHLSWFLFEKLISCVCFVRATYPASVRLYRTTGSFMEGEGSGNAMEQSSLSPGGYRLDLSFRIEGPGREDTAVGAPYLERPLPETVEVGHDAVLIYASEEEPRKDNPWVNRQWWHASDHGLLNHGVECCCGRHD